MARAEIDYRVPAHYGETLEIRIDLAASAGRASPTTTRSSTTQERVVASARTVQVMYDYATAKPVPIPDEIRQKMLKS